MNDEYHRALIIEKLGQMDGLIVRETNVGAAADAQGNCLQVWNDMGKIELSYRHVHIRDQQVAKPHTICVTVQRPIRTDKQCGSTVGRIYLTNSCRITAQIALYLTILEKGP